MNELRSSIGAVSSVAGTSLRMPARPPAHDTGHAGGMRLSLLCCCDSGRHHDGRRPARDLVRQLADGIEPLTLTGSGRSACGGIHVDDTSESILCPSISRAGFFRAHGFVILRALSVSLRYSTACWLAAELNLFMPSCASGRAAAISACCHIGGDASNILTRLARCNP